jgi:hypothetical protein
VKPRHMLAARAPCVMERERPAGEVKSPFNVSSSSEWTELLRKWHQQRKLAQLHSHIILSHSLSFHFFS